MTLSDLYPRLYPYLRAAAASQLRWSYYDTEDVVQDVLVRLIGREFESWTDARKYASTVLINLVIDRRRRERHRTAVYFEEWTIEHHDRYPQEECADLLQRWSTALPRLTEREKRVAGTLAAGYQSRDGAALLGMTNANYRVVASRLRDKLRATG